MSESIKNEVDRDDEGNRASGWVEYFRGAMCGKEFIAGDGRRKMIVVVRPGKYELKNNVSQRIRVMTGSLKYSLFPFNVEAEVPQGYGFDLPKTAFIFEAAEEVWYIATPLNQCVTASDEDGDAADGGYGSGKDDSEMDFGLSGGEYESGDITGESTVSSGSGT